MPHFKHVAEDGKVTLQFLEREQIESGRTFEQTPKTDADGVALKDGAGETIYNPKVEGPNWILGMLKPGSIEISDEEAALVQAELFELSRDKVVEALAYLSSTDWYVTRRVETGKEIPADILAKRQAARDSVK